ncbi:MAG TPA: PSD1 and planctomycete cytochrome C domain-containing protein [Pirellulales bacterium]|nr:PSD1 and planctomycete cytochrome C domain-containing protein [Pirellulales bacterium]
MPQAAGSRQVAGSLFCWLMLVGPLFAADEVDYVKEIKPLFSKRCAACHGSLKQENALRLDTAAAIRQGGDQGPAIVPLKSGESLLIQAVRGKDGWRMPPEGEGEPLAAEEIARLAAWIDQGAKAPDEAPPPDPRKHWSFLAPQRPAVPAIAGAAHPVDAFLAVEHQRLGLKPLPAADKQLQLRRAYLDLIGLPPTREELHAYLDDASADAYEKVVDRLLASPRYGERWGRHWMDVWRYSDWAGYGMEIRDSQRHIWRWRDWIIENVNADKPYDRMIVEMLAGDELAPDDPATLRATGFLARNWFKFNRNVWLDNTVEHTAKAFLGLTMNCARCHDHRYDPIAQEEYYQFRAFFEPYQVRTDRVPGVADLNADGLPRVYDADAATPTYLFVRGNEANPDKEHPLSAGVPAVFAGDEMNVEPVSLPATAYYPALRPFVQQETLAAAKTALDGARTSLAQAKETTSAAENQLAAIVSQTPPAEPPKAPAPFLSDDFATAKPELWQTRLGQWEYRDGHLLQKQIIADQCKLTSLANHPPDFTASFRFQITGGEKWKSVGLSFDDAEDGSFQGVFLSAYAGGPKLQVYHSAQGKHAYPLEGAKTLDVKLNQPYLLKLEVRGNLLNVSVDGQMLLAYRLPGERRTGRLSVWAFDATAEFLSIEAAPLDPAAKLVEPTTGEAKPGEATTLDVAKLAVEKAAGGMLLAEKSLAAAETNVASIAARIAADNAQYATPAAADAEALSQAAAAAEKQAALAAAERNLIAAQQAHAAAQAAVKEGDEKTKQAAKTAETKLAETNKALEAAKTAAQNPGHAYSPLDSIYPATSTGRRLALARWIASSQNPLTARVAVNQMWLRHFGDGLVPTVFDFGLNGKPPVNPALLDWLAVEFIDRGWSMKAIHRLIVTSDAYRRQSSPSAADASNAAIDPDNRNLWRFKVRRMEGELVRDSVLACAGALDPAMGGAEIDQNAGETSARRSVYFRHAHEKYMTFLKLFDAPSVTECYRRDESIVPQQALALANSSLSFAQSRKLAGALSQQAGAEPTAEANAAFIVAAFEQVLSRQPTDAERAACEKFLAEQARKFADPGKLTAFAAGPAATVKPSTSPHQRARENLVHVLFNHNDFVTIR